MDRETSRNEYRNRVQKAILFIQEHLEENPDLSRIAEAACFSPFHFHRIFTAFMDETPAECAKRLRLEKAANLILQDDGKSMTEIGIRCGFATPSAFTRDFRHHFGMAPAAWRKSGHAEGITRRENRFPGDSRLLAETGLTERESLRLACALHLGSYGSGIGEAWGRLMRWAGPNGMIHPGMKTIGISWDNPSVTAPGRCRYEACIPLPDGMAVSGSIYERTLPAGTWYSARFTGSEDCYSAAYSEFYYRHLPDSGYTPADFPAIERYLAPVSDGIGKDHTFDVEISVPVIPFS